METELERLLDPDFDLNAALAGGEARAVLERIASLLADETRKWLAGERRDFAPGEFKRWRETLDGLQAGIRIAHRLILNG